MRDEFEGRLWADHGADFANTVDRLLADIGQVFDRMTRIQFAAPGAAAAGRRALADSVWRERRTCALTPGFNYLFVMR